MSKAGPPAYVVYDHNDLVNDRYTIEVIKRGYHIDSQQQWITDLLKLDTENYTTIAAELREGYIHAVFDYPDALVSVILRYASSQITVLVASNSMAVVNRVMAEWRKVAPVSVPTDEQKIPLDFWTLGERGPQTVRRIIDVPTWEQVGGNYTNSTLEQLNRLFASDFKPSHGGQLLLWHGKPGTGKTYALRALAYEWRKWCSFEYVVDPEQFFGGTASYLVNVLMGQGHPTHPYLDDDEDDEEAATRWRCLIFEDTGELLSEDASERTGQGLSRLLNVVDGLIGQGLRVMILVTTNEELHSLHPAVSRPGRAAVNIFFKQLTITECHDWAQRHNLELPNYTKEYTVAELFGILEGHNLTGNTIRSAARLGFQPTPPVNGAEVTYNTHTRGIDNGV